MKVALIPPIPNLKLTTLCDVHLLLSHLVTNRDYSDFYRHHRIAYRDHYLILDNSAHEFQAGEAIEKLLCQGLRLEVNEIVIPDVLFEAGKTISNAETSFKQLTSFVGCRMLYIAYYPRLMVVPQGSTPRLFRTCLKGLIEVFESYRDEFPGLFSKSLTIGVSKDYEMWDGGLYRLLEEDILPTVKRLDAQVHMLGWGRDLWAIYKIDQKWGDRIRSIDSAKPFVYAKAGITLEPPNDFPEYPKRSEDYFTTSLSPKEEVIAQKNVRAFCGLVNQGTPYDSELL